MYLKVLYIHNDEVKLSVPVWDSHVRWTNLVYLSNSFSSPVMNGRSLPTDCNGSPRPLPKASEVRCDDVSQLIYPIQRKSP